MSSAGQFIGGGVGAIAGFFIAGPTGAKYGAQIGIMLGGLIDPPKGPDVKGPRLDDLSVQTSTYGAIIPRTYGTTAVFGNIFWLENNQIKEIAKKKKTGGKGGGSKTTTTTYSYYATFALGLCEGPIVGIRRVWIGGKLLYDAGTTDQGAMRASNQAAAYFTLYTGTDTQTADPRMQATLGATNVPGYRGLAYLVFNDLPLADYGNTLMGAQIKVEVVGSGSISSYVPSPHFMPAQLPWSQMDWNGRYYAAVADNPLASDLATSPDGITWTARSLPAGATGSFTSIACTPKRWIAHKGYRVEYWTSPDCVNWQEVTNGIGGITESWIFYSDGARFLAIGRYSHATAFISDDGLNWTETGALPSYSGMSNNGAASNGEIWVAINQAYGSAMVLEGLNWTSYAFPAGTGNIYGVVYSDELGLFLAAGPYRYATSPDGKVWTGGTCAASNGGEFYSYAANRWWSGQKYSFDGSTWIAYPLPNNTGGTNIYSAVWNGAVHCIVGSNGIYESCWTVAINTLAQTSPTLANIVETELLKSALLTAGDINVTALASITVRGYSIASVAAIRSGLEPLQAAWPFDAIQAGYKIKFVKRGGVSIASISAAELDARSAGDSPGASITNTREMDIVLPRKVRLLFSDYDREYDAGEQYAERLNTDAVNIRSIELAIVLTADEAAGMAEVLLYLAWLERYDIALRLPSAYNHLEPADVITVNASEGQYELRLTSVTYTQDGRVECQAKYNSAATYTPAALGVAGSVTDSVLSESGDAVYSIMDIPAIIDLNVAAGVVMAMTGYLSGWPGGTLFSSADAGQIWESTQGFSEPGTTMGVTTSILPAGRTDIIDTASTLSVSMIEGSLSSVSESSLFNGANWFAIGAHGRWEIVAAKTCTLVSGSVYTLTDFLRGRYGTEWAMSTHAAGDWIVQLDGQGAVFVGMPLSSIGAEIYYRGITSGQSFDSDVDYLQTFTGVSLECFSPVYLSGYVVNGTNDWSIAWIRRPRIGGEWKDYIDAPLSEAAEAYTIKIYTDGTYATVTRTLTATAQSCTYTSTQQTADFGAVQGTIYVGVAQVSANVGDGYEARSALTSTVTGAMTIDFLVAAGGGGGGTAQVGAYPGGGGGAGGVRTGTVAASPGSNFTLTVGAGGATNTSGANSTFGATTCVGGGRGIAAAAEQTGGSGGGTNYTAAPGAAGTAGEGNAGGGGTSPFGGGANYPSGGGGGSAAAGGNGNNATIGGAGGAGLSSSITTVATNYGGGGGGGVYNGGTPGAGGVGGGGAGSLSATATAGTDGTGGGGGGGGYNGIAWAGGKGGDGVVIARYPDYFAPASTVTGSPTITVTGGYRIYKWTTPGAGSITI